MNRIFEFRSKLSNLSLWFVKSSNHCPSISFNFLRGISFFTNLSTKLFLLNLPLINAWFEFIRIIGSARKRSVRFTERSFQLYCMINQIRGCEKEIRRESRRQAHKKKPVHMIRPLNSNTNDHLCDILKSRLQTCVKRERRSSRAEHSGWISIDVEVASASSKDVRGNFETSETDAAHVFHTALRASKNSYPFFLTSLSIAAVWAVAAYWRCKAKE